MTKERAWKQPYTKAENPVAEFAVLTQIEDEWMAARLSGKRKNVEQLIDDAYRGATSHGLAQTKKELVDSVGSSPGEFTECVHSERAIDLVGTMAISTGVATLVSPKHLHSYRYLRVYVKSRGKWKLIASQSTPLSSP
ncbi:MAG: nuclear transport factor 2 family protein [Silvibacterium sp.]|nr:nuclear transport factor 2 family protein [Silvibacterium sp.]